MSFHVDLGCPQKSKMGLRSGGNDAATSSRFDSFRDSLVCDWAHFQLKPRTVWFEWFASEQLVVLAAYLQSSNSPGTWHYPVHQHPRWQRARHYESSKRTKARQSDDAFRATEKYFLFLLAVAHVVLPGCHTHLPQITLLEGFLFLKGFLLLIVFLFWGFFSQLLVCVPPWRHGTTTSLAWTITTICASCPFRRIR